MSLNGTEAYAKSEPKLKNKVGMSLVNTAGEHTSLVPFLNGVGTPKIAQLASLMHQFNVGGPPS